MTRPPTEHFSSRDKFKYYKLRISRTSIGEMERFNACKSHAQLYVRASFDDFEVRRYVELHGSARTMGDSAMPVRSRHSLRFI